jgi:hypothetical protein
MKFRLVWLLIAFSTAFELQSVRAWDYEGHRLVNQLALASLPTNFPSFVQDAATRERIAFLAGEPDRWRNTQDLELKHVNGPDHYIDIEELADYGMKPETLPMFRYDFVAQLAIYRKEHPEKFEHLRHQKNDDHTRELVGLLPWAITENYSRLKSEFSYLKAFQQGGGTENEISNAERNAVYTMGVMGHYVGDASQPLHVTIHHHGWVGANPNHYATNSGIHGHIDAYFRRNPEGTFAKLKSKVRAAGLVKGNGPPVSADQMFQVVVRFIVAQQEQVAPLYELDKAGKLHGDNEEGTAFLEGQLLKSGQLLGDIWFSAYEQAPADTYLMDQLARRER